MDLFSLNLYGFGIKRTLPLLVNGAIYTVERYFNGTNNKECMHSETTVIVYKLNCMTRADDK